MAEARLGIAAWDAFCDRRRPHPVVVRSEGVIDAFATHAVRSSARE
jgi:hypothetical protein